MVKNTVWFSLIVQIVTGIVSLHGLFLTLPKKDAILTDILGLETTNHFLGRSIFSKTTKANYHYLVQPYDGTYLGVIKSPFKLIYHLKTDHYRLFDLQKDPNEKKPLPLGNYQSIFSELKLEIGRIFLNNQLIIENRIIPKKIKTNF